MSSWLDLFQTAVATHDYQPSDRGELPLRKNQLIYIAAKRNDDWYIGCVVTITTPQTLQWGLFPSAFCEEQHPKPLPPTTNDQTRPVPPPIPQRRSITQPHPTTTTTTTTTTATTTPQPNTISAPTARKELHEYYFRHHRQKIHNLPLLLKTYKGNYSSLYQHLQSQFQTSPNHMPVDLVDLEAPRQTSAAEHTVQLTWTTRELYECHTDEDDKTPMDRHGEHRYTIALKYQNVSSSVNATQANTKGNANTNDDWTLVVCKDSLQVKFDGETGLTTVWLTGLCPNCDYQCCLTLYDLCTNQDMTVRIRNASVSHFKTTGVKGGESARQQNTSSSPQRPTRPTRPTTTSTQNTANSDSEEDERSTPTPPPRPHKINTTTATTATTATTSNKPARPPRTTTLATSTTTSTTASSNAQYFKSSKMLWMGFQELLNTEEKYVQDMTYLLVSVVHPLQQNTASSASSASFSASASSSTVPSIPSTAVHAIFCNLEQTVGVNR